MSLWSAFETYPNTGMFFLIVIPTEIPVLLKLKPFSLVNQQSVFQYFPIKKLHLGQNTTQTINLPYHTAVTQTTLLN